MGLAPGSFQSADGGMQSGKQVSPSPLQLAGLFNTTRSAVAFIPNDDDDDCSLSSTSTMGRELTSNESAKFGHNEEDSDDCAVRCVVLAFDTEDLTVFRPSRR